VATTIGRQEFTYTGALPTDSAERKDIPLARGCFDYFPAALAEVARLSLAGNIKHNPGEELHWARGKSMDHADCIARHQMERGTIDTDGFYHDVKTAWRALAQLQELMEKNGAPLARGARLPAPTCDCATKENQCCDVCQGIGGAPLMDHVVICDQKGGQARRPTLTVAILEGRCVCASCGSTKVWDAYDHERLAELADDELEDGTLPLCNGERCVARRWIIV
jgi:hypothetical protein